MLTLKAIQTPGSAGHHLLMLIEAILRAARILKAEPGYSMSLARLHAQLIAELGPQAGSYSEIYQQLQKRADSFMVLDSARRLDGTDSWPRPVREAYDHALDSAGFGSCVRVTLTEPPLEPEADSLISALSNTIADLCAACEHDPALEEFLQRAKEQVFELNGIMLASAEARPTTPLPDPPRKV